MKITDTERLDWLLQNQDKVNLIQNVHSKLWVIHFHGIPDKDLKEQEWFLTERDVIDAEINRQKKVRK